MQVTVGTASIRIGIGGTVFLRRGEGGKSGWGENTGTLNGTSI
jgi:hypothetical protein